VTLILTNEVAHQRRQRGLAIKIKCKDLCPQSQQW